MKGEKWQKKIVIKIMLKKNLIFQINSKLEQKRKQNKDIYLKTAFLYVMLLMDKHQFIIFNNL